MTDSARLDVWLFNGRFYKSRSLAADAVQGGLVHLNGARVKPARAVKPGDVVSFRRGSVDFDCEVLSLPPRRGPAPEAQACGEHHQYPDGFMLFLGTMFAPTQDRFAPGQGFTHLSGDVVSIANPRLGTLVTQVVTSDRAPAWRYGTAALMRDLARRGLLT